MSGPRPVWLLAFLLLGPAAGAQDDAASPDQPGEAQDAQAPSEAPTEAPAGGEATEPNDQAAAAEAQQAQEGAQAAPDGGADAQNQDVATQLQQLRAQLQDQQAQMQELRQQLDQRTQETEQLGQVNQQLQGLNDQFADAQAREQAQAEERASSLDQLGQTLGALQSADAYLAVGNGDAVGDVLDQAANTLTGQARDWVIVAQQALDEGDLFYARTALQYAVSLGVANQVGGTNQPAAQP